MALLPGRARVQPHLPYGWSQEECRLQYYKSALRLKIRLTTYQVLVCRPLDIIRVSLTLAEEPNVTYAVLWLDQKILSSIKTNIRFYSQFRLNVNSSES